MRLFFQLGWFFLKQWKSYLCAISMLIIVSVLQLIPPKIVGIVIDYVINKRSDIKFLFLWLSVIVVVSFIIYVLRCTWRILLFGSSYKLGIELRNKLYYSLSNQLPDFFLRYRTGDLIARATNDVDKVIFAAGEGVLTLVDSFFMGGSVLLVMGAYINFKLTLLSLLPMPFMITLIILYGKKLRQKFYMAQVEFAKLNNITQDNISNIRIIKSFGLEHYKANKFADIAKLVSIKNMLVAKIDALFEPTIYFSVGLSNLISLVGGSFFVINNEITIGQLTSFIIYLNLMVWPMLALALMLNIVERGGAAYSRIYQILIKKKKEINYNKSKILINSSILKIRIKYFRYNDFHKFVLKNIFLNIYSGYMFGICGPTGSGKSTLLSLILRYFDINSGNIYINNIAINKLSFCEWYSMFSVVSQNPFLFSGSIADNISFGDSNITLEKIIHVAKLSCLHNEILSLPNQYETQIGELGMLLSSGQKQRLSLARSLLLNRKILILDNVLSSVDYEMEFKILNNLLKWGKKKTLIIVSHNLSVLKKSNSILVLHDGSILQQGNHLTLINQPGWYSYTYNNK